MKIIELASYAYFKGYKGFEKNNSGFAYAVSDICETLSAHGDEIYLITQSAITAGFSYKNIFVLKKKWIDIFLNFMLKDVYYGLCAIKNSKISLIKKIKTIYYYINRGYIEKKIRDINPDVIHIQSISNYTVPFMLAAARCNIPFIVTNHGLSTFLEEVEPKQKMMEGEFFKLAEKYNTVVTTVSSGIKKRLIEHYNLKGENIKVVFNGLMPNMSNIDIDIGKLNKLKANLGIETGTFTFICVGSISHRKNQLQVVRAFHLLLNEQKNINKNIKLIFAGQGPLYDKLKKYVANNGLEYSVIILGNVEHNEMPYYYTLSNCTIMASLDEGFGLPVIEGYSFGIPSIMYKDLDAAMDITSSEVAILVDRRDDAGLAKGMRDAIESNWNAKAIKKYSLNFSNDVMGKMYHKALEEGIRISSTIPFNQIISLLN